MDYSFLERLISSKAISCGQLTPKCGVCKKRTQKWGAPQLFLLPVYQDKEYTPSAEYYSKSCYPIMSTGDIPIGRRACRMWVLQCPECGERAVLVVDFLKVRGQEVTEKMTVCDYAPLSELLNGTQTRADDTFSAVQSFEHTETTIQRRYR